MDAAREALRAICSGLLFGGSGRWFSIVFSARVGPEHCPISAHVDQIGGISELESVRTVEAVEARVTRAPPDCSQEFKASLRARLTSISPTVGAVSATPVAGNIDMQSTGERDT